MGELRIPQYVTPIVAMLAGDPAHFHSAKDPLEQLLGSVELESPLYPFDKTAYYNDSMGPSLQRKFYSFEKLSDPGGLAGWKLATNGIEANLGQMLRAASMPVNSVALRPINLDVGYITGAKLVLASTKDFAHRIYLRDGIFAEITMGFRGDGWASHAFTFPDFKSGIYNDFLNRVRERHLEKAREWRRTHP